MSVQFEVAAQSIRNWIKQAELDEGRREDGLTTDERGELQRLQRENRLLREEREILKKAAAWFAQETKAAPNDLSQHITPAIGYASPANYERMQLNSA